MRRFWRFPALAAICLLVGFWAWSTAQVSGQTGQPPQQAAQTPGTAAAKPAGTGKISGRVIAADNGAPVKRVTVTLMGGTLQVSAGRGSGSGAPGGSTQVPARGAGSGPPPGLVQKQTDVDASGRFEFTDLPAGRFSLNVNFQGGFIRTQTESVLLADAGSATVTIRLERTGAITGKVFDEAGDPLPRAQLRATRWESSGGVRRLMQGGGGGFNMTNDLGEYRLWDVPPGDYYVSASYMTGNYAPPTSEREDPKFGFAPTFYPGTASMDGARTVTVRSGQDTPGVDITLQRAKMGRVTAIVLDSAGSPLSQRSSVYLASRHDSSGGATGMSRRPDGSYLSGDVPPGDYYLVANQSQGDSPAAAAAISEGAVVPVSVNGDEVTFTVQLNRGATVSGRVVVEGKMPEPTPVVTTVTGSQPVTSQARIMVSARQASNPTASYFPNSSSGRPAPMRDDGTFELTGLRGSFRLMASGNRAVLKSARQGGRDILTTPLELSGSEHIKDVEIVVTTETGTIDFSVVNSRGEPAAGAFVLMFSDDATLWFEGSPYVRQARTPSAAAATGAPSSSMASSVPTQAPTSGAGMAASATSREPGRLMSGTLVPGRYGVIAFEPGASITGPAYDPEAIEKMRSRATFVTVVAGQAAMVQLKTVKQ